ncbi:TetR/AcrR family transcriptional regulator [Pseudonocardia kongjuensis]|uniref:TetR/AcrR family transcriptional regulator n=1 Tax=Pseudonocardia kongjuensis TaxID=102227 RepID=A0ABN1XJ25_9PSEU
MVYGAGVNASRTARERARAELVAEITAAARRQLADTGAAALSMRAVSRELGMVSSALHRYFPTRDDLLTALIVQSYDALADAVEAAVDGVPDPVDRWRTLARAVRSWALANPHEYALIYGSPVPGYRAPADTVPAAARGIAPLGRLLADAHAAGLLTVDPTPVPPGPADDAARLRAALHTPDLPDGTLLAVITAWTGLFGHLSFELFGQFEKVLEHRDTAFDAAVERLGRIVGLHV